MGFIYKIATTKEEFEKIHALNYKTFVEEIPQHDENQERILVDIYHHENTYLICLKDETLIGMIAVRGKRPFSLDKKLGPVEPYLPSEITNPCEIRLLSVEQEYRNGRVFVGLAQLLSRYCLKMGYDAALISGTTRQEKLYTQMGFIPFASLTGTGEALFQPMYLTKESFEQSLAGRILEETLYFMPGPVVVAENVKQAFLKTPISHRSTHFQSKIGQVKEKLRHLTKSNHVQIMMGSGTLANDVVAEQLTLEDGEGLILVTGEFGGRLKNHAERVGLRFQTITKDWGTSIDYLEIEEILKQKHVTWLWTTHCETSTGALLDLQALTQLCQRNHVKLCIDCISSIGTVPLDLSNVYLASGVSGKAICSFPGLAFVFHNHKVLPSRTIPRYLDLGSYVENESIPYTQSSNQMEALLLALDRFQDTSYYQSIFERYHYIRQEVETIGMKVLTKLEESSPIIMTIELPRTVSSKELGDSLALQGFLLHYESGYLQNRNWLQISCINDYDRRKINKMLKVLKQYYLFQLENSTSVENERK